jgi:hypothetical protein
MKTERILLGVCGVDSGQLIIMDPCYVDKGFDYNAVCTSHSVGCAPHDKCKDEGTFGAPYHHGYGGEFPSPKSPLPLGVVTRTGFGDGAYEVWAEIEDHGDWGKRVARITIDFMQEED